MPLDTAGRGAEHPCSGHGHLSPQLSPRAPTTAPAASVTAPFLQGQPHQQMPSLFQPAQTILTTEAKPGAELRDRPDP